MEKGSLAEPGNGRWMRKESQPCVEEWVAGLACEELRSDELASRNISSQSQSQSQHPVKKKAFHFLACDLLNHLFSQVHDSVLLELLKQAVLRHLISPLLVSSTTTQAQLDKMASKTELSLHLEKKQREWLEAMAKKYNLPSAGKALRISILYTKQADDDAAIFAKVQSIIVDTSDLVETRQQVDDVHDKYLQELVEKYGLGSKDKATRLILDYVMTSGDEATIFEVKRCRHGETCKNC